MTAMLLSGLSGFAQSWQCGDNIIATLSGNTLTISGTEEMEDWGEVPTPWYAYRTTITSLIIEDGITRIGDRAFMGLGWITSVTIPNSITSIGDGAFLFCLSLSVVNYNAENCTDTGYIIFFGSPIHMLNIGNNVKFIPDMLFYDCEYLTSVVIPNNVETIDYLAFGNCTNLQSVTIGKKCSNIGYWAFANCTNLSTITNLNPIPQNITNNEVFDGITNRESIILHVPFGTQAAYQAADVWKDFNIVDDVDDDGEIKMEVIVIKGGVAVFQSAVSAIDSVIFYNPVDLTAPHSNETLFIHKADNASYDEFLLDDIRKLSLSNIDLSVEMRNAEPLLYAINDIEKLIFGGMSSDIIYSGQDKFNVIAYFTKEGDLVVESPEDIQSLMLFGIDGRIIAARNLPTGIYLVRVETSQGVVVKKVIKQ